MNVTPMELYWILRLDAFSTAFTVLSAFGGILTLVGLIGTVAMYMSEGTDSTEFRKVRRITAYLGGSFALVFTLSVLTPTTAEMAAIKIIPALVNNGMPERLSKDAQELYTMGVEAMKRSLSPEKK